MKQVPFALVNLTIMKFIPQTGEATVRLVVNDGTMKQMLKTCKLDNPESLATELVQEARSRIKAAHQERSLDTNPLAGIVVLKLTQDEEEVLEKTTRFLAQARERARAAKSKRVSWGDVEKQITGLKMEYT